MMKGKPVVALVFLLSLAALADPRPYSPDRGPLRVLTIDELVLHDAARDKDLRLKIYYPEGPGPFPVIIFSHGAFASRETYSALGEYWASYGYVSIHPSHADSMHDSGYRGTLRQVLRDSELWRSRPQDISFVIDSLPQIEKLAPTLKGKLDRARIGVGGHSYGAYTAVAIGGATVLMPGAKTPRGFADKRVRAIVVLSPQGEGEMGLTSRSWEHIRVPMLAMYGSRDFGTQRRTPTWRSQPFNGAPEGDKYDVELQGATHFTLVGPFRRRAIETKLFKCAKLETIAFWDTYLKDDEAAREYLAYEGLKSFCGADARIDRK
ncbi:MAG: alpha/beta fold hydrolase [Acidobacteriia bacterium]|nr:alpha/beta fold hydrolase [Terriglobia bacterium]